ncbi:MAG: hypothetical protein M3O71_27350 [Bacteroidota bacterium]|nr:hypothetical protein [Bacteroidota bacterium]
MRRLSVLLTILLMVVINYNTSAQIITKYGDNVSTLDGIIKAYYDVVTVKKGGKVFFERDSLIHWPGVLVGAVSVSKSGKSVMHSFTLKEYHRLSDPLLEKDGFYEREISRKVEKFGAIYHVWSTYESRNEAGEPIIERGINSIELFYDGIRFWIMGWIYDGERKNNPIPAEYLK